MANENSVARPYAKALFEYGLAHHALPQWSDWLQCLACLPRDSAFRALIKNPALTRAELTKTIVAIARELTSATWLPELEAFIGLLVRNSRLNALPAIAAQFLLLREAQEKTLCAEVCSFSPLTQTQRQRLAERLSQRYARQVTLRETTDPSLLGGMVIHLHDVVIDGSIRGQLTNLIDYISR